MYYIDDVFEGFAGRDTFLIREIGKRTVQILPDHFVRWVAAESDTVLFYSISSRYLNFISERQHLILPPWKTAQNQLRTSQQ